MLVVHHVTYSINSLCHFFGRQAFDTGDESRNLLWLAPFTFGEAWHNNHHAFPTSSRTACGAGSSIPRRAVIAELEKLGLAWDVVRISPERQARKALRRNRMAGHAHDRAAAAGARRGPARAPVQVTFWDGTELPATNGAAARRSTCARPRRWPMCCARRASWARPRLRERRARARRPRRRARPAPHWKPPPLDRAAQLRLALAAARAAGPVLPPPVPAAELRPRGRRHSPERDARAVRHHYDVANDFFALFLDESMTYSCAFFSRAARPGGGAGARSSSSSARSSA